MSFNESNNQQYFMRTILIELVFSSLRFSCYELKMNSFRKVARKCCFVGKTFFCSFVVHTTWTHIYSQKVVWCEKQLLWFSFFPILFNRNFLYCEKRNIYFAVLLVIQTRWVLIRYFFVSLTFERNSTNSLTNKVLVPHVQRLIYLLKIHTEPPYYIYHTISKSIQYFIT